MVGGNHEEDNDNKTPTFPRKNVIERQAERTRKVLKLDTETLDLVRGGAAAYGGGTAACL